MKYFLYAFSLVVVILPPALFAAQIQGKVIRVLDGDTIEVLQEQQPVRVRLLNIDAPEKKQPFGRWSTNQLKALLAGQSVTVSYTQTDRYGRVLGRVVTANGTEANRQQVLKGAAWVYDRYNTDNSLPTLQREAQTQKLGLWLIINLFPRGNGGTKTTDALRLSNPSTS